jgi:hypothetical protein
MIESTANYVGSPAELFAIIAAAYAAGKTVYEVIKSFLGWLKKKSK